MDQDFCTSCKEHERRLLQLENNQKINGDEIASLRASRHEHSNWLNRHNLEINALLLQNKSNETFIAELSQESSAMHDKYHNLELKIIQSLSDLKNTFNDKVNGLKVEQRYSMLIIAILTGIVIFVAKALFTKWLG